MSLVRALALTLLFASSATAQSTEARGTRDVRLNGPGGPRNAVLTLARAGDTLSGTITAGQGEDKVQRSQKGSELSVTLRSKEDDGAANAATALDLTGAWAFEVTSPFGKGTPTVTFKQTGEALTGTYAGQMGEIPLEGSLRGTVLAFGTDMAVAKLKIHILYTGTASEDELKGTIKYGDLGEGTFTARRK